MGQHWIPVKPQVKERPRLGRRRKAFTPPKTLAYESFLKKHWVDHIRDRYEGPLYVGIEIHIDGIMVTVEELECSVRPVGVLGDLDNYQKSVWDGIQDDSTAGIVAAFANDKQVEWAEIKFVGVPRTPRKVA